MSRIRRGHGSGIIKVGNWNSLPRHCGSFESGASARANGRSPMALLSLPEYEVMAAQAHGHLCAGQILGLRLALYGMRLLGLDDPAGADRKRLITYVEIDRCATDAIAVVTGCRLGKRALKFLDFGKVAATFCDLRPPRAVRVVALESARDRARELYPDIANKN